MELKIKDIIELLQVSEKTIYRWIKEKKIPAYRIGFQYRFNKTEINEWILTNKISVSEKYLDIYKLNIPKFLYDHFTRGGIFYDIEGNDVHEVIKNAIQVIPTPSSISKESIIQAILDREKLMSTAIGKGLALPHPRHPIITEMEDSSVSLCLLKNSVDFHAMDNMPVQALFVILSATPKKHLEILSKISFLCQMDDFLELVQLKASRSDLLEYIHETELQWEQRSKNE